MSPDELMIEAYVLRAVGQHAAAVERSAAVLTRHHRRDASELTLDLLERLDRHDRALAVLEPIVGCYPGDLDLQRAYGTALSRAGRGAEAIDVLRRVLAANCTDWRAASRLTYLLMSEGRPDEAADVVEAAISGGAAERPWCNLAAMLFAEKDYREHSERYLRRAEACGPMDGKQRYVSRAIDGSNPPQRASANYVRALFNGGAKSFDENLKALKYQSTEIVERGLATIGAAPGAALRVLDAGCGTGLCGPVLRPVADRLVGVDLSDGMLGVARERGCYDELGNADILKMPASFRGAFDLIVSCDVLIYVGRLDRLFRNFRRGLKAGGHLLVSAEAAPDEDLAAGYEIRPSGRFRHTERYLRAALASAGFKPEPVLWRQTLRFEYDLPVEGICVLQAVGGD